MKQRYFRPPVSSPAIPSSLFSSVLLIDQLKLSWQMKNLFVRLYAHFGNWEWCRFDPSLSDLRRNERHPLVLIFRGERLNYTPEMAFRELGIDPQNLDEMHKLGLRACGKSESQEVERLNREFFVSVLRLQACLPSPIVRRLPAKLPSF